MSEESKKAREAMKAKAKRLVAGDPREKVDSSSWSPPEAELGDVQTGARPLVKRLYKKGGKVVGKHEGADSHKHAGRMPRKAGGRTDKLTPDSLINRDVRTANEVREGKKHDGAFKKGGVAKYGKGGRMPLEGHPYHKKTDAELRYISKDAAEAARAMKGMNSKAEGKYLDQVNDAQTILGHRQRTGNGPESGMNKGGRAEKFGGGPMGGNNPLTQQDQMMAKAAGMMKRGGRTKHATDGKVKPTGIEPDFRPSKYGETKVSYSDDDKNAVSNLAKYGSMRGNPTASPDYPERKSGGKIKHTDEAQDKKLMHKVLKPTVFKAKGGSAHDKDCTCHRCGGGRTMKYGGGGVFSGNSKEKVPGADGGRTAHARGGKAGKGKTQVNIIIGAHGQPQGQGNMPNAPVMPPRPPVGAPVPPPQMGGGAPMLPPGMPPQGMPPGAFKKGGRIAKFGGGGMSPIGRPNMGGGMSGAGMGGMNSPMGLGTPTGSGLGTPLTGGPNPMGGMGGAGMNVTSAPMGLKPLGSGGMPHQFFPNSGAGISGGMGGAGMGGMNSPMGLGTPTGSGLGTPLTGGPNPMGGMGGGMPQKMPYKRGGRTGYPIDSGSGGGEARLEKIDAYGLKPPKRK